MGEEMACREVSSDNQNQSRSSFEQVFWHAAKKYWGNFLRPQLFEQVFWRAARNTGVILRPQTPLSYPSKTKTVRNDVTLIHSSNLR
jgi:hypothetical protein